MISFFIPKISAYLKASDTALRQSEGANAAFSHLKTGHAFVRFQYIRYLILSANLLSISIL